MSAHSRFLAPDYGDGVSEPRLSSQGFPLPNPRSVSTAVHQDDGFHDHAVTVMLVAWGQFMDHDITLTAETRDEKTGETPECCDVGLDGSHPDCLPIDIPPDDKFFNLHKRDCFWDQPYPIGRADISTRDMIDMDQAKMKIEAAHSLRPTKGIDQRPGKSN